MLELDHPPLICLYIRYVFLSTIGIVMDSLLPVFGKLSFPSAVPFGFVSHQGSQVRRPLWAQCQILTSPHFATIA